MRAPKRLPFLMSGRVCHLIVFSPHMPLTLLLSFLPSHQLCVFLIIFFYSGVTLLSITGVRLTG